MFVYKKEKKPLKPLSGISKAKVKCAVNTLFEKRNIKKKHNDRLE